ncbi:MAG TPA: hypothetical protein VGR43_08345 [Dehalococcoidia bacterium]|jgi:hypothetical protein|nr:hypothetical protein [Dehalococcoidia bacterium]
MALETKPGQSQIEKLRRQIADARVWIAQYQKEHPGEPFPFMKAKGILKGKVHFTDEEIEAAKIRPRDLPPE